ncbi:hypothetical protein JJE66_33850 [Bradyrhizobium diazoefficiens]|uniref:hypothetical protein n=1 Tax=Bradyrhizobium diazoefficiens TaxID=1355477 RepID=UPI00190B63F7|nr:hypothetical protein [Bradyrhizobium diazoefficiens]MBK3666193.1 hypothetical protein [Bradyrhizobium diazoefficiens]
MADEKVTPVKKFQIGFVKAAIWRNNGYYNTVVAKSYKKDDGTYDDTPQLGHADIHNAIQVLQRAEAWIAEQQ